jgi:hypothetical protein
MSINLRHSRPLGHGKRSPYLKIADHVTGAYDHGRTSPRFAAIHTWTLQLLPARQYHQTRQATLGSLATFANAIFVAPESLASGPAGAADFSRRSIDQQV